ncbi:MAG: HlyD family secretion protein [Acetobacteraceae bacterium]|nr:HlyD family secretion protein [Acetobacteraceae bacterium]
MPEKSALQPASDKTLAPPPAPEPPRRNRRRIALLLVPLLLGLAAVANWWIVEGRFVESTDNAYVQGDIASLAARIDGTVMAIDVADNAAVHAGDPLIRLDPRDWQARLDQARAAAAEAEASEQTARLQAAQARTAIAQAMSTIAAAEAEVTRARNEADRSGALVGGGWASRQSNDAAIAAREKAEANLAAARASRAGAEAALAVAEAQRATAAAHRQGAAAAVTLAENNLSYTVIRAPSDGVVGNRAAQIGQPVVPGQLLIAVTPPPSRLFVTANFKETQLRRMAPGQAVRLVPDIDSGAAVRGTVASIAPATGALFSLLPPENATGNFTKVVQRVPVRIAIDPRDAAAARWLRAGLSVTAEVDTRGPGAVRHGLFGAAAATLGLE